MPPACRAATPASSWLQMFTASPGSSLPIAGSEHIRSGPAATACSGTKKEGPAGHSEKSRKWDKGWNEPPCARQHDLLLKASRGRGVGCDFRPDNFQRNAGVLKKLILRLVNLPHPAASNKTNDRKATGDELPGLETARAGRSVCGRQSRVVCIRR